MKILPLLAVPLLALCTSLTAQEAGQVTPALVVAASQPSEWSEIASHDVLVMELAPDSTGSPREVMIQLLPPPFSQAWVDNIRTLARAHWWDGTSVYRVVDNWVAQWGDGEEDKVGAKPLPAGLQTVPESEYAAPMTRSEATDLADRGNMARAGLRRGTVSLQDPYAALTTFEAGWPIGTNADSKWPVHCYASVGVARDLSPDTGTGAELYAVIGQAPRQLDRNIAVVGRVIEGIEHLSTLPRGTGENGVYGTEAEHIPILSVRLASEVPETERPHFEYLASDSASFLRYVEVRANRHDDFYKVAAGGVDVCNVQVPIRRVGSSPAG